MTLAMRNTRLESQVAAKPMACGNTVASPERATPWRPSFHQLYSGMARRSIAGARSIIWETFSSRVMRPTRSAARRSTGKLGSCQAGVCAVAPPATAAASRATTRMAGIGTILSLANGHGCAYQGIARTSFEREDDLMSRFGKYLGPLALAGWLVPAGGAAQADPWAAPVRGSWARTGPAARGDVVLASRDSGAEIVAGAAETLNVRQAAVFLAGDIEAISGYRPPIG